MLKKQHSNPVNPQRVVIIGARGFVGRTLAHLLAQKRVNVVEISRSEVDLAHPDAPEKLRGFFKAGDVVVNAAAVAPCKNLDMLSQNLHIIKHCEEALQGVGIAHLVNISSDAIYGDFDAPITEAFPAAPTSYHGVMHLMREVAINNGNHAAVTHVRPTLIYGAGDPHNGYGPNRFARQAAAGEVISLFGQGEERRDHIHVEDVAQLIWLVIAYRATGVVNAVTGQTHSFYDLAQKIVTLSGSASTLHYLPRQGAMPHNGYRPFDAGVIKSTFSEFKWTEIEDGLRCLVNAKKDAA